MNVAISRVLLEGLIERAEACASLEICGLLVGERGSIDALLELSNAHGEPSRAFAFDPAEHLVAARTVRESGKSVVGHYHSHPSGDDAPSATDAAQAQEQGVYWLIVAGGEAGLWISRRGGSLHNAFEPIGLQLG